MKTALKKRIRSLLMVPPFYYFSKYWRGSVSSLMYHRVVSSYPNRDEFSPNKSLTVSEADFHAQMEYLSHHFRCISVDQFVDELKEDRLTKNSIVVTFDDGYLDNLTLALPVLEKFSVPAIVYIATGLIDRKMNLWWMELEEIVRAKNVLRLEGKDYPANTLLEKRQTYLSLNQLFKTSPLVRQESLLSELRQLSDIQFNYDSIALNWDQVRELDRHPLVTIGAHTINHASLKWENERVARSEVSESKVRLENELGHEVGHFAYPFGSRGEAGKREFELLGSLGFRSAFSTRFGHVFSDHKNHPYSIPRVCIDNFDQIAEFKWKISGFESMRHNGLKRFVTE